MVLHLLCKSHRLKRRCCSILAAPSWVRYCTSMRSVFFANWICVLSGSVYVSEVCLRSMYSAVYPKMKQQSLTGPMMLTSPSLSDARMSGLPWKACVNSPFLALRT